MYQILRGDKSTNTCGGRNPSEIFTLLFWGNHSTMEKEECTCQNLSKAIFVYVQFSVIPKIALIYCLIESCFSTNLFADNLTFQLEAKDDLFLEFIKIHLTIFQSCPNKNYQEYFLEGWEGLKKRERENLKQDLHPAGSPAPGLTSQP